MLQNPSTCRGQGARRELIKIVVRRCSWENESGKTKINNFKVIVH
jgi:hypothetical protein